MVRGKKIRVGISVGDPNGIGPEITLKLLQKKRLLNFFTPVAFSSMKLLSYYKNLLSIDVELRGVHSLEKVASHKLNVINVQHDDFTIKPGEACAEAGQYTRLSLESATRALRDNHVDVLVTAPLNKDLIHSKDFPFVGHTDYLQSTLSGEALMLMIHHELKVALLTHHIPLKEVSKQINISRIIQKIKTLQHSLHRDFGIAKPKIAVLGLNPHASDNGLLGDEEEQKISPAIEKLFGEGILVFGPYPADSFFGSGKYKNFDAILAMYHDQGLIPFKTLTFGEGVNFTAGLSYVRTSPDHGVAYDIAGKGIANANSLEEAIFSAVKIFENRKAYDELESRALSLSSKRSHLKNNKEETRR
ncbi:4-hydroxythreonine-4-phosphate dehydrogenase PdxA [Bacteroidetes bacterium endosymbiont of Geopemphigus sp.]|uniref:4-hydroxythreonine-4-phosphate dehydrogenase PdxA n=1 Tax=Bacteroidetes bacterium endosymbiont of Geopemphigus sp. TaxID=2047937 RepID=UPI0018A84831|nr:4-hydroxythreonine-4-phosphate dehydrogenase PdxA [Bacteroidetes bacterium endosymbiont of Geopemphigus sp.]